MKTSKVLAALLLSSALTAGAATAKTVGSVTFPDTVQAAGQTLQLNGIGKRVFVMVVDGYATALYLPKPAHTAAEILAEPGPKLVYTQFLHSASLSQVQGEFRSVYKSYCSDHACSAAGKETFDKVLATATPMKVGDTQSFLVNGDAVTVSVNNKEVLTVHNAEYAHGTLESLLGSAAPTGAYRRGLLGTD